jgi:putative hydrolase of the HAD superfamily
VHNLWDRVPDDVLPALRRLRENGLRLGVVSNSNGTVRAKLGRLGLLPFFETVVDSAEEGVEKPDPRIFRIALDRMAADPATTLHVGDLYHVDVDGARAAGLRVVLLDPLGLYPDADCRRVPSLTALADWLAAKAGRDPSTPGPQDTDAR